MNGKYDDIINLQYPQKSSRPKMPMADRAAQFSPFAALTGFGAAITETARQTGAQIVLTEDEKALLNQKLQILLTFAAQKPQVGITYFLPDERKQGGVYLTAVGVIKKADSLHRMLLLESGTEIPLDNIVSLDSELFDRFI